MWTHVNVCNTESQGDASSILSAIWISGHALGGHFCSLRAIRINSLGKQLNLFPGDSSLRQEMHHLLLLLPRQIRHQRQCSQVHACKCRPASGAQRAGIPPAAPTASPSPSPTPPQPVTPPSPGRGDPRRRGLHSGDPAAPATCTDTGTSLLSCCSDVARICSGFSTCPRQAASRRGVNGSHGLAAAPRGERTCPQPAGSTSQERVRAVSGSGSGGEAEGDGGVTEKSSSLRLPSLGLLSKPRPALKDTSGLHP